MLPTLGVVALWASLVLALLCCQSHCTPVAAGAVHSRVRLEVANVDACLDADSSKLKTALAELVCSRLSSSAPAQCNCESLSLTAEASASAMQRTGVAAEQPQLDCSVKATLEAAVDIALSSASQGKREFMLRTAEPAGLPASKVSPQADLDVSSSDFSSALLAALKSVDADHFSAAQVVSAHGIHLAASPTLHPTHQPTLSSQYESESSSFLNRGYRQNMIVACSIVGSCFAIFICIVFGSRMAVRERFRSSRIYGSA